MILPTPAAVVFDLDGVLVDSEPAWAVAEERTVLDVGGVYTPELRGALHGRGHRDGARIIAERFGGDADAVADSLLAHALAELAPGVSAIDGAHELVAALRGRLPIAVASNSVRAIVELALASAGFDEFDAVVTGEDVAAPKPAPDAYLEACRRLGVAPAGAVGIEDSPAGAKAVKAAGMTLVGLGPAVRELADVSIDSLRELSF